MSPSEDAANVLKTLNVTTTGNLESRSPIDGSVIGSVAEASTDEAGFACGKAEEAFRTWRTVPAPRRGELVRLLGEEFEVGRSGDSRLAIMAWPSTFIAFLGRRQSARRHPNPSRHAKRESALVLPPSAGMIRIRFDGSPAAAGLSAVMQRLPGYGRF